MTDYLRVLDFGRAGATVRSQPAMAARSQSRATSRPRPGFRARLGTWRQDLASRCGLTGTLSLLVPGSGQLLLGETSLGLLFLSTLGFLGCFTWAILATLDRLAGTLDLLGLSLEAVYWTLGIAYVLAAAVHLASVIGAARPRSERDTGHPLLAGVASSILPGWGQVLNGHRGRAALFLTCVWGTGAVWILSSDWATGMLNTWSPGVPAWEGALRDPIIVWAARWTFPLLVWCLAVYDAAAAAARYRRPPQAAQAERVARRVQR